MGNIYSEKVLYEFPENLRILAIDTDPTVLELIKKICKGLGYEVMTCKESVRGSNILRERKVGIDLVVMEVHMPEMDGFEFLLANQEIDVPVIMMSLDDNKKSVMKSIKLGGCDYWIKPLHEDRVKNMWTHVVRNRMRKHNVDSVEISSEVDNADNVGESSSRKKPRMVWTSELHAKFVKAVNQIGLADAVPNKICQLMNMPGLTRNHVASHLQKYRNSLKTKPLHKHVHAEEASSMALDQHFPRSSETMTMLNNSVSVDTLQQQQMQQWMQSFFL